MDDRNKGLHRVCLSWFIANLRCDYIMSPCIHCLVTFTPCCPPCALSSCSVFTMLSPGKCTDPSLAALMSTFPTLPHPAVRLLLLQVRQRSRWWSVLKGASTGVIRWGETVCWQFPWHIKTGSRAIKSYNHTKTGLQIFQEFPSIHVLSTGLGLDSILVFK